MEINLYEILGLSTFASLDECKKAYKTLASKYHTDRIGDGSYIQLLNKAKEVLCDAEEKSKYDEQLRVQKNIREERWYKQVVNNAVFKAVGNALRRTAGKNPKAVDALFSTFKKEIGRELGSDIFRAGVDGLVSGFKNLFKKKKS